MLSKVLFFNFKKVFSFCWVQLKLFCFQFLNLPSSASDLNLTLAIFLLPLLASSVLCFNVKNCAVTKIKVKTTRQAWLQVMLWQGHCAVRTWLSVLLHLGCSNSTVVWVAYNNRNVFLTALEAGKSKTKVLTWSVLTVLFQLLTFHLSSHGRKRMACFLIWLWCLVEYNFKVL